MNYLSEIETLTKDFAKNHSEELLDLYNSIPEVEYLPADILLEEKNGRVFYDKWRLSLAYAPKNIVKGCLIGYKRLAEPGSEIYDTDCFYLNILAVDSNFRNKGIGNQLVKHFINICRDNRPLPYLTTLTQNYISLRLN